MRSFVSMKNMEKDAILNLLHTVQLIKTKNYQPNYKGQDLFVANLFFEPSTRTKMSFEVAEKRLGFHVLDFEVNTSSVTKGESIYDTAKTYQAIGANLIVVRHQEEHTARKLSETLDIPVINAGDGCGEHPTQCLLDLYTMYESFDSFNDLNVLIVGDILHSRVARSNAYALKTLGANVFLSSKASWQDDRLDFPYIDLDEGLKICDVAMFLRVQRERHEEKEVGDDVDYLKQYGLTTERYQLLKDEAIVMHPAPVNRGVEIEDELVEAPKSKIFRQMENGVYARMAILDLLLSKGEINNGYPIEERLLRAK